MKTHVFEAMQSVDMNALSKCSESELRPVLPALVRMALCSPLDSSERGAKLRKKALKILSGIEVVNNIVGLLSIDFHALEQDVRKEQQLRSRCIRTANIGYAMVVAFKKQQFPIHWTFYKVCHSSQTKSGISQTESMLLSQLSNGLALEFERSDPARRIRLILSQLLFIVSEVKDGKVGCNRKVSELFDSPVYLEEVSDVLCIAHAELPDLLILGEVSEALLCLPHGSELMCQLVANFPESFAEVCSYLVSRGDKVEEDSEQGVCRLQMLRMLAAMNPKEALNIRALCVEHCTMPGLAIALTLQISDTSQDNQIAVNDIVSFISSLLLGSDQSVRNWFSQFVKAGQKRQKDSNTSMLQLLRQHLLHILKTFLPKGSQPLSESAIVPVCALIRLYAALKGIAALKYSDEEIHCLLELLTCQPPLSLAGTHFVSLAVCMLISSPHLLSGIQEEQKMMSWMRWLMSRENLIEKESGSSTSFGEVLFLVALHFHSNQVSSISDLVSNTLGMKSVIKSSSLSRLRVIFTQELFTEQVVAAHAIKIPVTKKLDASYSGYLPIHSILQLLKSRVFSRHKVPIKDWIYRQLCESAMPLHPLLPQMVDCFVSTLIPKGVKVEQTNQPFTESEILAVYSDYQTNSKENVTKVKTGKHKDRGTENLAPQLLVLYYVLLYQDTLLSVSRATVVTLRGHISYSEAVLAEIPINYLVQETQRLQQQCSGLFPALLRLLVSHYPHLCLVEDWLEESPVSSASSTFSKMLSSPLDFEITCTQETFEEAVSHVNENPALLLSQLQHLLCLPPAHLHKYAHQVVNCLSLLLQNNVPRKVLDLVQLVWFKLHALAPRSLRLATVNVLQPRQPGLLKTETFAEQDVVVDPLVVLRCDERVFRCPPVLAVVLRVLSAYLQASRIFLHQQVTSMTSATVNTGDVRIEKDRLELKNALVATQESACLQILLEVCMATPEEQERGLGELSCVREIQCAIFSFMHQVFIQDPYLAKLIHFQGYPSELLPLMVAGVPSMHICLDFIPELLGQPQVEKQIFGIQLLAALCIQYALPKSMNVARLSINIMFTLLTAYGSSAYCQMFAETVPSLVSMCKAFPPLCEDVTSLLIQLGRVCRSQLAITSNTAITDASTEDGLSKKMQTANKSISSLQDFQVLHTLVQDTFQRITDHALVTGHLF